MASLKHFCDKAICLNHGRVSLNGEAKTIIDEYQRLNRMEIPQQSARLSEVDKDRRTRIIFQSISLLDIDQTPVDSIYLGDTLRIKLEIEPMGVLESPKISIGINDLLGQRMLTVHTPVSRDVTSRISEKCAITCEIPNFPLAPGDYSMKLALTDRNTEVDVIEQAILFTVQDGEQFGEGRAFHRGVCIAPSKWAISNMGV